MLFLITYILLRRKDGVLLLTIDNLIILVLGVFFGVVFPITYFYSLDHRSNAFLAIISNYTALDLIQYYLCVFLFLLFFAPVFRRTVRHRGVLISNNMESEMMNSSQFYFSTVLLFLIGVVADFLYCRAYGGYIGYLEYASYVRSGITDLVYNRWSFLIAFRDCIVVSSYMFFAQIRNNGKILLDRVLLFAISFVLSCMVLFANKGRLSFLIYFSIFIVAYILKEQKGTYIRLRIAKLSKMCVWGLIGVIGFWYISNQMGRSDGSELLDTLFKEVSFVFSNFKTLIDNMEFDDARLFVDIISYPLYLLPSRFWRVILPNTASDIITIFIFGSKKGVGDVYGEVPIDSISIGYIQFGLIGVAVFGLFFGYFIAKLFNIVSEISNNKIRNILVIYITIDIAIRSIFYADSYSVVQRIFSLVVFGLIYWCIGLISKKNKKCNSC